MSGHHLLFGCCTNVHVYRPRVPGSLHTRCTQDGVLTQQMIIRQCYRLYNLSFVLWFCLILVGFYQMEILELIL
jgi:hypothetical protein